MKRGLYLLFSLVLVMTGLTITSCEDDPCKDVTCDANSDCFDGECICKVGFEKDAAGNCVAERNKFVGTWSASDVCSGSGSATYITVSTTGTGSDEIKITNFWDLFTQPVVGKVSDKTITVARQEPDGDKFFVEGTGTYDTTTGKISWTFKVTDETIPGAIVTDNCTSVWTKS